ncbi:MAG TPA: hypothetical protein VM778_09555 [Gemmatimonadota bacterium]|nr:hypothetical protein [Gemmatimonadota bacterium]
MTRTRIGRLALAGLLAAPLAGCGDGDELTAPVTIVQIQLSNGNCGNLLVGGSCALIVIVIGSDGEPVEEPRLRWFSENIVIATVSGSGVVSGINQGTATIRVETVDGGIFDETTILVRDAGGGPPPDGPAP